MIYRHIHLIIIFSLLCGSNRAFGDIDEQKETEKYCAAPKSSLKAFKIKEVGRKDRQLGNLSGYSVKQISRKLVPLSDAEWEDYFYFHCQTLEFEKDGLKFQKSLSADFGSIPEFEDTWDDPKAQIEGATIAFHIPREDRYAEGGEEEIKYFDFDSDTKNLKFKKSVVTSETQQQQSLMMSLLKDGKLDRAMKLLSEMEKSPDGHQSYALRFFEKFSDPLFSHLKKILKSGDTKRVGRLALQFFKGLDFEFEEDSYFYELRRTEHHERSPELIRRFNDFAYYLDQGGERKLAQIMLKWIVDEYPGRTVAHLNLANSLWRTGDRDRALKHFYIYKNQMAAFQPKQKVSLLSEVEPALSEITLTENETSKFLGFQIVEWKGKKYSIFLVLPYYL